MDDDQSFHAAIKKLSAFTYRSSISVHNVSKFVTSIEHVWHVDPEYSHQLEYNYRTRVLRAIAQGRISGVDASEVCRLLVRLSNRKLEKWFA
jgi:hypothetical protein